MLKRSESQILKMISEGELFECDAEDGSFSLKIENYAPAICTAVHDGHSMRASMEKHCALTADERLYEEDPFTGELVDAMPITLIGRDSRYEYDLNRPLATCIYKKAWGKEVWHKQPTLAQRKQSLTKHKSFYKVLDALIHKLEIKYGACIVFDVHSYNYKRLAADPPTFNIGTEQIDLDRWLPVVDRFRASLEKIKLNVPVRAVCNEVFYGRGYLIAHVNSRFENTLVLPCEVKKVFMDELSGEPYRLLLNELKEGMKHCLSDTGAYFSRRHTRKLRTRRLDMLSSQLDPAISTVDQALYRLSRGMETLNYINPINITQEKRKFFARKGNYQPVFRYRPLAIDPFEFKKQLYRLPVDKIRDPGIQQMYCQVIDGLSSKIDLLVNAGNPQFVYSSLKYYGEPSLEDEANACFLLHAAKYEPELEKTVTADEAVAVFRERAAQWGMDCKVELSNKIVAAAMVSNGKKTLYVNKDTQLSQTEVSALCHHELGVHMATTLNAAMQPLKVFSLGLPGNTMTQEGLAILNEYHSGHLFLRRLQELALRVMAVKEMLAYGNFRHTYSYLLEEMNMDANDAFKLAVRVHRSGGFTKDYLYLRGVSEALKLSQASDVSSLYIGKTGFAYLPLLDELVERDIIKKPFFVPEGLKKPTPMGDILEYLMSSIRPTAPVGMVGLSGYGLREIA
ncbi:MAG: flavohemoglobin expression-modulating QEGLA motif protein [Pontibacterium sp.]